MLFAYRMPTIVVVTRLSDIIPHFLFFRSPREANEPLAAGDATKSAAVGDRDREEVAYGNV